jgi:hypothetical protein
VETNSYLWKKQQRNMRNIFIFFLFLIACRSGTDKTADLHNGYGEKEEELSENDDIVISKTEYVMIEKEIKVGDYHTWIASLLATIQENRQYPIDEYTLIHANPQIIESLRNTDYYWLKEKGIISDDPQKITLLSAGDSIIIPDSAMSATIQNQLNCTYLDINIPEYLLRIMRNDTILFSFPIRVGKNDKRYLAMAKTDVDLRTMAGEGQIIRINRNPAFINPKDNKRYKVTRRDDGVVTALPNIPWIEPEINGIRYGQLIHPTTNLETLGKAVSNGCIGLSEADAWTVFFYTPLGTKIRIRYDLDITNEAGESIRLKNIYPGMEKIASRQKALREKREANSAPLPPLCHCGVE